jgi:hypothetical protein
MEVDSSRFSKLVDAALRNSTRELSVAVNSRMYFLLLKTMRITKRADTNEIMKLGVTSVRVVRDRATGKYKRATSGKILTYNKNGRMRDIILGGYWKKYGNLNAVDWNTLDDKVEKKIAKRLRSKGYLASLWRFAVRRFDRYAAQKGTPQQDEKSYRGVNGIAKIARPGWNPVAEAGAIVAADHYGNELRPYAQTLVKTALQRGMNMESAAIKKHLEDKAKEACRSAGFVVR